MDLLLLILAVLLGLLVGGVINALADDLPFTFKVRLPHYPDTKPPEPEKQDDLDKPVVEDLETITQLESADDGKTDEEENQDEDEEPPHIFDGLPRSPITWLGTLAFLTGKHTSPDGKKLSWRHPAVEIIMALLYFYLAYNVKMGAYAAGPAVYWSVCLAILMLITVIDMEHRLILFVVIIPGCLFAIIGIGLVGPAISDQIGFTDYLLGGLAGFAIFTLMYLGGLLFSLLVAQSRGEALDEVAFGYGDVMLATLSGFMIGWQALIFAIFIAVFAGAAGALFFLASRLFVRSKYELYTALPYGQYIVFGTVIMMLWRQGVICLLRGGC